MSDEGLDDVIQCVNCILQIQHLVRIKCCECDAILCVLCFRMGAETGEHRRGHNYEVVDVVGNTTFQFDGAWGSQEESNLIAAAQKFKMGNWTEMVKHMGSLRSAQQASDYFDRCFIRGPVGQFGLAASYWTRNRDQLFSSGKAVTLLEQECMPSSKCQLILEALRSLPETDIPSKSNPNLKEVLQQITREHISAMKSSDIEPLSPCLPKHDWILRKRLPEMEELDISSDEEVEKVETEKDLSIMFKANNNISPWIRGNDAPPMNGKIIEESDDEEQSDNQSPFLPAKNLKRKFVRIHDPHFLDSCNGHADEHVTNGVSFLPDVQCKSSASQQQFVFNTEEEFLVHFDNDNNSAKYSSSNGSSSNDDMMETEGPSVEVNGSVADGSEELGNSRGSFNEETQDYDELDPDQPSTSKCNGSTLGEKNHTTSSTPIVRRKKKNAMKSKKMRRLDAFEKRMNSKNKKKEIEDQELEELCPTWEIKSLRDNHPSLCLDVDGDQKERPKIRQDDLKFLGYNILRDEFEHESFNEAETLISKLFCQLPEDNNKTEFVNNNIKFARIQNYIRTLNKRNARRRAVIEHGKIPEFFNFMKSMGMEKRSATEIMLKRSPVEKLKCTLQQSLTKDEHSKLCETVERAEYLKNRIIRLQELQKQGVTTLRGEDKERNSPKKTKRKGNKAEMKKLNARWSAFKRYHKNQFTNGLDE